MGQTHESPGGKTLWQRKLQSHTSILICRQLGIEEGGLVQVLTHLHLRLLLVVNTISTVCRLFGILGNGLFVHSGHHHSLLHDGFCHRDGLIV